MNQDLLRVFETESDYDSAKDSFVYPTVSYVRDVDEVKYMSKPLLPIIDTTGYATEFAVGEYYPQEALVFKAIYDMYSSYLNDDDGDYIGIESGELYGGILDVPTGTHKRVHIAYVGDEPLYINYLIHLGRDGDAIEMHRADVSFEETSYSTYLRYSDGLYKGLAPS